MPLLFNPIWVWQPSHLNQSCDHLNTCLPNCLCRLPATQTKTKIVFSVCYDRAPRKYRMVMTFLLSATWHGFFPGYYMTFLSGHIVTLAQRKVKLPYFHCFLESQHLKYSVQPSFQVRRVIRPRFQTGVGLKMVYEVITWFATHLAISYIVIPFVILEFQGSFRFFKLVVQMLSTNNSIAYSCIVCF